MTQYLSVGMVLPGKTVVTAVFKVKNFRPSRKFRSAKAAVSTFEAQ